MSSLDLTRDDWTILEFHEGKQSVPSIRIEKELTMEYRKVIDSLHNLHSHGLVYFSGHAVAGSIETIVSKITDKGIRVLKEKRKGSGSV